MAITRGKKTVTRRKTTRKVKQLVDYTWKGESYVIDLNRDKVYRNWMAIDTNQGVSIIGAYRASQPA